MPLLNSTQDSQVLIKRLKEVSEGECQGEGSGPFNSGDPGGRPGKGCQ